MIDVDLKPQAVVEGEAVPPTAYWWMGADMRWWPPGAHVDYLVDTPPAEVGSAMDLRYSAGRTGASNVYHLGNHLKWDTICPVCGHGVWEWHIWSGPHRDECVHPEDIADSAACVPIVAR